VAAQRQAAAADAAQELGLVADADLAHLDAGLELGGQVLDQGAEIHPAVGGVVEHHLGAVEDVLHPDELHDELVLLDEPDARLAGALLAGALLAELGDVARVGLAEDAALAVDAGGRRVDGLDVDDGAELGAALGLDDAGVALEQGELVVEIWIGPAAVLDPDVDQLGHASILRSSKARVRRTAFWI